MHAYTRTPLYDNNIKNEKREREKTHTHKTYVFVEIVQTKKSVVLLQKNVHSALTEAVFEHSRVYKLCRECCTKRTIGDEYYETDFYYHY